MQITAIVFFVNYIDLWGYCMEWSLKHKLYLLTGSVIIIASVYLGFKYIFPIVAPFVIAYGVALVIEKPVNSLARLFKGKKGIASTLIVIIATAILLGLFGYLLYLGLGEIKSLIKNYDYYMIIVKQKTARLCMDLDGGLGLKNGASMDFIGGCLEKCINAFDPNNDSQMMTKVVTVSVPAIVRLSIVIGIIIVCLMSIVYLSNRLDHVREWREKTVFQKEVEAVTDGLKRLFTVYFRVQLIIIAINSAICVAGLMIIKNPYAFIIGILIGLVDALPIFGTGTFLIPWALILLLFHDFLGAAVLISVYLITYFVREIMESKCMGDRLGISPFTMLMVIFIGLLVYGILGFILGPVSFVIIKALIDYLKTVIERDKLEHV